MEQRKIHSVDEKRLDLAAQVGDIDYIETYVGGLIDELAITAGLHGQYQIVDYLFDLGADRTLFFEIMESDKGQAYAFKVDDELGKIKQAKTN